MQTDKRNKNKNLKLYIMNVIADYLKDVKANRYTYKGVSEEEKQEFRALYKQIKANKHLSLDKNAANDTPLLKKAMNFWLTFHKHSNYEAKFKAMECLREFVINA